ncbi:MAG: hypothetical protein KatS3mg070_0510 [Meiothermus sp.]|nr:MAG: hypothetical protein KatS3mg070_0510 [Meiothermus sp.]
MSCECMFRVFKARHQPGKIVRFTVQDVLVASFGWLIHQSMDACSLQKPLQHAAFTMHQP